MPNADRQDILVRFPGEAGLEGEVQCPMCAQRLVFFSDDLEEQHTLWLWHLAMVHGRLMTDRVH